MEIDIVATKGINIAFVGCTHGELDTIYSTIANIERSRGIRVELLLCCGDFEAVRNAFDLSCLAGPSKYHHYKDFYKYYNGEVAAPILTIFVGGNHEAANHLRELYYGGWAAPNIYFLGYSGVVNYGGLRIGGFSGIYKRYDFFKGHYEVPPYSGDTVRSAFHVREYELYKLSLLRKPLDVILSHDWPDVTSYGDVEKLCAGHPHWKEEIEKGELGCHLYTKLLKSLKPSYWLSGHMHCRFDATVQHTGDQSTHFIALDKVLPRRPFLDVVSFPEATGPRVLTYDLEWLAILRATHQYLNCSMATTVLPKGPEREHRNVEKELQELTARFAGKENALAVPLNFAMTVEPHRSSVDPRTERPTWAGRFAVSHQTEEFLELVGLPNNLTPSSSTSSSSSRPPYARGGRQQPPQPQRGVPVQRPSADASAAPAGRGGPTASRGGGGRNKRLR